MVKKIDVKIAKPRSETSPNYKAFNSTKSTVVHSQAELDQITNTVPSRKVTAGQYNDFLSPVETPCKPSDQKQFGNFSLGNTFYGSEKVSYTDRLNNFVQRFSQELTLDPNQKLELLNCKKRFSQEARGSLSMRLARSYKVKTEERIRESDEFEGEEDAAEERL